MKLRVILLATCFLGILISVIEYFLLPEMVALHFNMAGEPDLLVTKIFYLLVWLALFVSNGFWLLIPPLLKKAPKNMVNIPHRDFYMAPENKDRTLAKVESYMTGLGVMLNIFLMGLSLVLFLGAQGSTLQLDRVAFFALMGALLIFVVGWIVAFRRAFPKPKT